MESNLPTDSQREGDSQRNRFQTINAILLALVSLLGAFLVWRSSVAADASGDASLAAVYAVLNAEETRTLNEIKMYEDYREYTGYVAEMARAEALAVALETAAAEEVEALGLERIAALAAAQMYEFPREYLAADGSYDMQRQLGEAWAESASEKDLDEEPHLEEAAAMSRRSSLLISIATLLAVGLVAHTLAETLENRRTKQMLLVIGLSISVVCIAGLVAVEWGLLA